MELDKFCFPVEEREISLNGQDSSIGGYKAIVRPTENGDKTISVVKNSYKLIPNREIIEPFMEQVQKLDTPWYIDDSHTFAEDNRMRLQVTFPELYFHDGESTIPLSMYLHNSYDMSEGVRVFFGAIRLVCSNGMVLGNILGSFYGRHTSGFEFERLTMEFGDASEKMSFVDKRIRDLQSTDVTWEKYQQIQKAMGQRRMKQVLPWAFAKDESQWTAYNDFTRHISHDVAKERRSDLQRKLSSTFNL